MVDNENIDNTDNNETETGGRKRKGLFGTRRVVRKAPQAGYADASDPQIPVAESPEGEGTPEDDGTPEADVAPEAGVTPAAEAEPAQAAPATLEAQAVAAHEPPALPDQHGEVEPPLVAAAAPGLPPTTLLFQAPDPLPLPPLAESDEEEPAAGVRRRSRRRAGETGREGANDPANTVVKVRAPREPELITEPQKVKGSTRLEAKKQRRRDGRDAGRRRPVITEAEFLARRESVDRQMVVREKAGRIQIGVLEDKVLVEHYVARSQEASLIGNVYLGRVQNVLPSMEAAFVDIGRGRNAVLYSGEVDWDAVETGNQPRRIELALKAGDRVLVQVTKDPVGHKGARLTSQISLPGRYLVYVPGGSMNGISRKLPDTERSRLKKILKEVLPENAGVIVRTAAEGATEEQLTLDVNRLTAQWADISTRVESQQAPALLHSEPDLLIKIIRDVFNEDFQKLVIAGDEARQTIENYLRQVAPDLLDRVEPYTGERDAFDEFRITEQIEKALERKVWLPSGGSLVIDRTEAMTVVDVNTGKFVGSGGNLEETVTKNNLEAAEEIVRQLRLRDIGGIIVVDFIDMVLETNRDLVLRRLVECLSRDRTKHQVAEVTSLGLVQMTRKKLGLGLLETFSEACEVCAGRGVVVHHDPVVKHRQPQQQPQSDRRRGRGGNGSNSGNAGPSTNASGNGAAHTGTHAITDDAKNALAKIAASTIHHEEEAKAAEANLQGAGTEISVTEVTVTEVTATKKRRRKGRGGADRQQPEATTAEQATDGQATPAQDAAPEAAEATEAAEAPSDASNESLLPILDLPEPAVVAPASRSLDHETELLLDSVLDALPAPKEPGQGRGRSRRASTTVIAGGELAPKGE
ncbi:Rne/Rng family ribonuclease [Leifsonia sp. fls2-241-R2A-40a]|uniref:Rne/Rng family ribonuclease n=1 Tax=Leifsonia sp. fls2-241-R2A-40a TaxID=3040290 RepID=UPI00254A64C6|nr:Rne/Rng family ribonuclease [Leifsonia sp. fls2-241-R2A-40a]